MIEPITKEDIEKMLTVDENIRPKKYISEAELIEMVREERRKQKKREQLIKAGYVPTSSAR